MNVFIQELEFDPNHPYTITIIYFTSNNERKRKMKYIGADMIGDYIAIDFSTDKIFRKMLESLREVFGNGPFTSKALKNIMKEYNYNLIIEL